jgi:prepilin-type N-terminal cleavage/methylation domain-containing protein
MICLNRHFGAGSARRSAFTMTEMVVVISIVALLGLLVLLNLSGVLTKSSFKAQVQEFISTMQMAANAAAESDKRYEVIIDIVQQSYMLREVTSPDLSQVLEEEIITQNDFGSGCWVAYVIFDDGDYTNEAAAKFRAARSGWQYGGKIVLLDSDEQPHSVVVERLNRMITLQEGDVEFLAPRSADEVPF